MTFNSKKSQKNFRQKFDPFSFFMSDVQFKKHRVFRETEGVIFYDISVDESNASDLVVHTGPAQSPPDDMVGAKQFIFISFKMITTELYQENEPLNW